MLSAMPQQKWRKSFKILGDRIRHTRKAMKMTQEDLALKSDTPANHLGKIERGQVNPTSAKLFAICKVLGIDVGSVTKDLPIDHDA
jgi:transcriptional regulator with XRE-family HTH domain